MSTQKRIITPELEALYHTKPVDTLSNQDLFQVLQFGTRTLQAKAEVLSRLKSDPNFIYRLFDFGQNGLDPRGTKFSDWFNASMPYSANYDAQIFNEISKNHIFREQISKFIPQLFADSFYSMSIGDTFAILNAYMTWIDHPRLVFNTNQGIIAPVFTALKYLSSLREGHIALANTIHSYLSRFGESAGNNVFLQNPGRARSFSETYVSKFFICNGLHDIKRLSTLAQSISCLDNVGYKYTTGRDASDIKKLCSSKLVPEDLIVQAIEKIVSQNGFDRLSLISEINSRRTLDVVSNFVTRDECFKLGNRNVRGFMLEDELGL